MADKRCEWCGGLLKSEKPHAKFCAGTCRQAAYRLRVKRNVLCVTSFVIRNNVTEGDTNLNGVTHSDVTPNILPVTCVTQQEKKGPPVNPPKEENYFSSLFEDINFFQREHTEGGLRGEDVARNGDGFATLWAAYPRKVAKKAAEKAWHKLTPTSELLAVMLAALERQKATRQWQDGFVPHLSTWLNGARWEDEEGENGTQPWGGVRSNCRIPTSQSSLDRIAAKTIRAGETSVAPGAQAGSPAEPRTPDRCR